MTTTPLRRTAPGDGRILAGLADGIARQLDVDVAVVRLAFVLLTLVGGLGVPLYLAGWLLVPDAGQDEPPVAHLFGGYRGC